MYVAQVDENTNKVIKTIIVFRFHEVFKTK